MRFKVVLVLVAILTLAVPPAGARADGPVIPSIPSFDPHDPAAQPTADVRRVLAVKQARYEQLAAAQRAWLQRTCPSGVCPNAGTTGGGGSFPYSILLNVAALQQQYCNWCAPAATQEVQYWNNSFGWSDSQSTIASYEGTCFPPNTCGTYVYMTTNGLNHFVQPQPTGFAYASYQTTSSGDWWMKTQTDIAAFYMPQVPTVAPHDPDAALWLPDWSTGVYAGHYIVIDGYWGYNYSGGSVQFEDTSSGCMGNTGRYSTSAATMYYVIIKGNGNHPSNWIIW